jgi:hypothetical protein
MLQAARLRAIPNHKSFNAAQLGDNLCVLHKVIFQTNIQTKAASFHQVHMNPLSYDLLATIYKKGGN